MDLQICDIRVSKNIILTNYLYFYIIKNMKSTAIVKALGPLVTALICVVVAGLYGGFTVKRSILYIQALPGLIALILTFLAGAS